MVVVELAQVCPVRLAWAEAMHGGAFKGREVDVACTVEEWYEEAILQEFLGGAIAGE